MTTITERYSKPGAISATLCARSTLEISVRVYGLRKFDKLSQSAAPVLQAVGWTCAGNAPQAEQRDEQPRLNTRGLGRPT